MTISADPLSDIPVADLSAPMRIVLVPVNISTETVLDLLSIHQPLIAEVLVSDTVLSSLGLLSPAIGRIGWKMLIFLSGEPKPIAPSVEPKPQLFDAQEF